MPAGELSPNFLRTFLPWRVRMMQSFQWRKRASCPPDDTWHYLNTTSLVAQVVKRICLQCRRPRFEPRVGKITWRRDWLLTPFSCLENSMDRGAWWATIHGVTELDMTGWLTLSETQSISITLKVWGPPSSIQDAQIWSMWNKEKRHTTVFFLLFPQMLSSIQISFHLPV